MKKKSILTLSIVAALAVSLFIPSVWSFAASALSVFRVGDTKTIQITMTDIEEMMAYMKNAKQSGTSRDDMMTKFKDAPSDFDSASQKSHEPKYKTLSSVAEFAGFSFELPRELSDKTPALYALDAQAKSTTLDTALVNKHMADAGLPPIDETYNGTTITVNTPPAIVAKYENLLLFATQGVYVDAPKEIVNALWADLCQMPFLTENLRSQLLAIDPQGRDVYLPVIQGYSRETAIGANTGYIYALSELKKLAATLPDSMTTMMPSEMPESEQKLPENASALIWTKDGILYCLIGSQSDSELSSIARSIR